MNIFTNRLRWTGLILGLIAGGVYAGSFDARIEWAQRVDLSMPVSGVVESVSVQAGQAIKTGQILLRLEQTPFITSLQSAKAGQIRAKSNHQEALRDFKQTQELHKRGLISNVELENAKFKERRSEAAMQSTRAHVRRAKYDLKRSTLRAPFDGWVLSRHVGAGQSVVSTQQAPVLLVVAAVDHYLARGQVPEKKLTTLRIGGKARVRVKGEDYSGKILILGLEPTGRGTGSNVFYEVSVDFHTQDRLLRAGQSAKIIF